MAIHDTSKKNIGGEQQQGEQTRYGYGPGEQQNQSQAGAEREGPVGMGAVNQMFRRSGSFDRSEGRSAEALRSLREAEAEALATQGLTDDFELVRFDRDQHRVGLSSILVVKTIKLNNVLHIAVRPLILDSDGIRLPPRIATVATGHYTQRVEIPSLPQDVYNDVYWNRIDAFLKRVKGDQQAKVVDSGPLLVPSDFDFKDSEDTTRLLVSSVNSCDDIIARLTGEIPFSVEYIKRPDERLTARIDTTRDQVENLVGHPIRADLVVSMGRQLNNQKAEEDFYEVETEFNSVSGFVNLDYVGQPEQPQQMGWGQQQTQPQPIFHPSFVITSVDQADWIQMRTPELYLLAISNAFRVTAGSSWLRTFLPSIGSKGVDLKDVGALAYKTPAGQKVEVKSDKFSEQDFVQYMQQLVRPNPSFMIDVDPVGENSAIENYFIDIALDTVNRQAATDRLVAAANNLTGQRFSANFDHHKTPIVVSMDTEVHLGYYTGDDGEKRDIRDLDVVAMLNLTQGDTKTFDEWYKTYCDLSMRPEQRLQVREQMERQFLSKGLKITGRAVRLMLTPEFIEALDIATRGAGVHVEFENVSSVMGGQRFMGNTMVNQYAVSHTATMNYGGPTPQYGGGGYGGVTGSGRLY